MLLDGLSDKFKRMNTTVAKGLLTTTEAMMKCASSSSGDIARELIKIRNQDFKANDMWFYRFLGDKNFQIDDNSWRCYINSIFSMLHEQGKLNNTQDKLLIAVDFTSDTDDFLILCASLVIDDATIPLYFSMRNYPKRKKQMNQKKMELAFIKALRHILSDKYQYIIMADRGFGNDRFIEYCAENNFDTLIRIEPNMRVVTGGNQGITEDILSEDGVYNAYIKSWKKNCIIIRHSKDGKVWYMTTNMSYNNALEAADMYAKRFRIEKLFKNLKSGGFDIERSRIRKYDRFKRLLFLSCFAYSLLVLVGKYISDKLPATKKNSPIFTDLLAASLNLALRLPSSTPNKPHA
jgi:hypothetical protein